MYIYMYVCIMGHTNIAMDKSPFVAFIDFPSPHWNTVRSLG